MYFLFFFVNIGIIVDLKKDFKSKLGWWCQPFEFHHLHFLFCAFFFHFVELICLVPFQDGNKECLSDVDDLGN